MKTLTVLFFFHCCAIVLGLIGLLVMLPHPQIWDETASGIAVFNFNMKYMSSLYILLGAAIMLLYGLRFVGVGKTLIFFGASTLISLSLELLGTSTGFPFGPYAYTNLLGFKILGHVPYAIPLSWFYMGFTSYLLASLLVVRGDWRRQTLWSLLLGAAFLTVWDLSLDPSMASPHLSVQFWTWYTGGLYFGMPIRNLVGWSITGLLFMSISRLLWRGNVDTRRLVAWLPCGVYAANTCFAIALTLGAGIWQPSLLALLLGLLPAALVLLLGRRGAESAGHLSLSRRISHLVVRRGSAAIVRRHITSEIIGAENIPQDGPVMIVARHFHHLYDGCLLLQATSRRLHLLVALDWVRHPLWRRVIEHLCKAVDWPIML
ncbi:MAG TPA: carotenoid biosynthesis protein, partial [Ktedonobacteraceae bacterium]|nr:carotenoid biosynthesis protein [Ktedonobacteraceae bacterium]